MLTKIPMQSRQESYSFLLRNIDGIKSETARKPCWPFTLLRQHMISATQAIARDLRENPRLLPFFLPSLSLSLHPQLLRLCRLHISVRLAGTYKKSNHRHTTLTQYQYMTLRDTMSFNSSSSNSSSDPCRP